MSADPYRFPIPLQVGEDGTATAVWRPTGRELGPGPRPSTVPPFLVLEAMVQCAGELLRHLDGGGYRVLAAVDDAMLAPFATGEVHLAAGVTRRVRDVATVVAQARADGAEARAQLLMAPWVPSNPGMPSIQS